MSKKITNLREQLFETLELLKSGDMEIDRAKAICEVGTVIINSAKVEIEFLNAIGSKESTGFLEIENKTTDQ